MIMEPRPTQSGPCVNDVSSLSQKILKEGNWVYTEVDLANAKPRY